MINELFVERHLGNDQLCIGIDFDGTVVEHAYPYVGKDLPLVVEYLKKIVQYGGLLILNTMRGSDTIEYTINWFRDRGIMIHGINNNPKQKEWTDSKKPHAHIYVDDAAFGCPLTNDGYADWSIIGPKLLEYVKSVYNKKIKA